MYADWSRTARAPGMLNPTLICADEKRPEQILSDLPVEQGIRIEHLPARLRPLGVIKGWPNRTG